MTFATSYTQGVKITVDGVCWQHTHPHNMDVWELTSHVSSHPGSRVGVARWASTDEAKGRRNPISKPAETGQVKLGFPSHHPMERWAPEGKLYASLDVGYAIDNLGTYLGRYGDWERPPQ